MLWGFEGCLVTTCSSASEEAADSQYSFWSCVKPSAEVPLLEHNRVMIRVRFMWGAKVCLPFVARGRSDMAACCIGDSSSSKTAYFTLLQICSMKKQLTRILTAVLLTPIWGWGFFCKGWNLLPIQMMPSHITLLYLAAPISIICTFSVPWGPCNVHGEKPHCRLYLLHLPPLLPLPSYSLWGWQKQILCSVLQELCCQCPLVSACNIRAGLGEALASTEVLC